MLNFRTPRWAFLLSGAFVASSALAGAGDLVAEVVALTNPVTHSDPAAVPAAVPALKTYVAYTVKLTNNTPNTINNVMLRFSLDGFTAPSPPSAPVLILNPALVDGPGSQLPAGCFVSSATTIDCTIGQMRGNTSFPPTGSFVPLYRAPEKASGVAKLTSNVHVVYAESSNNSTNTIVNSDINIGATVVDIGTDNPVSIKSALPKAGGSLRTGAAGVPTNGNVATEVVTLPNGSSFAKVSVDVALPADCTQGHFTVCPAFTTSVRDPLDSTEMARLFTPDEPLKFTYRVHPSNLKMSAAKVLNSVLIYYTADGETGRTQVVNICPAPNLATSVGDGVGKPCFASPAFCYKRSTPGWTLALDGVCEWNLNNTKNGLLKLD